MRSSAVAILYFGTKIAGRAAGEITARVAASRRGRLRTQSGRFLRRHSPSTAAPGARRNPAALCCLLPGSLAWRECCGASCCNRTLNLKEVLNDENAYRLARSSLPGAGGSSRPGGLQQRPDQRQRRRLAVWL